MMTAMHFKRRWRIAALVAAGLAMGGLALESAMAQQAEPQKRDRAQNRNAARTPPAATPAAPVASAAPAAAQSFETVARQALIVDFQTGAILFEKNADERMPPSSMSKVMTAYLVFKALKEGRLSLEDMLPVSERAWRIQGSKMFVTLNSQVKVEDLIRGMIVQSGNDACIVLAEGLAGSEDAFAERMNEEARRIGLQGSNFRNSSGWPNPDHYMTSRDLATLARRLITDFPEHYKYYSELSFTYGKDEKGVPIKQGNRNPLLYKSLGADGIKTGHTDDAGYGLMASAMREGRRIIMVLNGMPSIKARGTEAERLIEWAYRDFANYTLFKAGQTVDKGDVWLGAEPSVNLVAEKDLIVTLPRRARQQMKATAIYDSPIPAPLAKGDKVGRLVVSAPGIDTIELPLVAERDVGRLGFAGRIGAAVGYLLWGGGSRR
jgi:D-alanyl-D-alanine carboxypeptidase (penicillin-binding protein 5/6)